MRSVAQDRARLAKQAPGFYRAKLGTFEVVILSDGIASRNLEEILSQPGLVRDELTADHETEPIPLSINAFLINTGSHLVLVLGSILMVQEAIKRFDAAGGSIINLSSVVGSHPVPGTLLYASTKGAIETLTKGLPLELAPRRIRVNAIAPGHTETEGNIAAGTFDGGAGAVLASKTPLGWLGRVADIAPLAVFLASDESAWITGEVIRAAGGLVVAT
jgi:NAD(P)-dependent dehydrogenase (short-subunit alcohol dehydrogenase family)